MDWAFLPPEMNSARMHAGPGPSPLIAASTAWSGIGAELESFAAQYAGVLGDMGSGWSGPSAAAATAAGMQYVTWLQNSAEQAYQTAAQAQAAAAAHEAAYAATVHPALIAQNRARLATLVATNILGQNTPAIMATESEYMEYWAQDVSAMAGYHAASTAATSALPNLLPATPNTNPLGLGAQGLAVSTAAATPAGNSGNTIGAIISALLGNSSNTSGLAGFFSNFTSSASGLGPNANLWNTIFTGGFNPATLAPVMGQLALMQRSNELTEQGNIISEELAKDDERQLPNNPVNPAEAPTFPPPQSRIPAKPLGLGKAGTAGFLSVPPNWDKNINEVKLASTATPLAGTSTGAVPAGGPGMMPTPIAAVSAPGKRDRKQGEEILVKVKFIPDKGV